jgi:hypothetical protein
MKQRDGGRSGQKNDQNRNAPQLPSRPADHTRRMIVPWHSLQQANGSIDTEKPSFCPVAAVERGCPLASAVKCWDVQCPISDVSVQRPTDPIWSDTCDMGHWTSQHLTADGRCKRK